MICSDKEIHGNQFRCPDLNHSSSVSNEVTRDLFLQSGTKKKDVPLNTSPV